MLTRLYSTACLVLRHIDNLAQGYLKLESAPFFFTFAADVAAVTILRLLKGSTAQYLDADQAKEMFFLGISLMKRLSLDATDIANRMVMILTQLWNSEKAFKHPDGSENTALRIRTRLAMSPIFDAIWWWREEFGGQPGAYPATYSQTAVSGMFSSYLTSRSWLIQLQKVRVPRSKDPPGFNPTAPRLRQLNPTRRLPISWTTSCSLSSAGRAIPIICIRQWPGRSEQIGIALLMYPDLLFRYKQVCSGLYPGEHIGWLFQNIRKG
jgi:hypothetical protein